MSSLESHPTATYTSISSVGRSWSIPVIDPYEEATLQVPEQAPPSPDYVPGLEYSEYKLQLTMRYQLRINLYLLMLHRPPITRLYC
nr:hypothetical protein [Tanacetum cinerariifolium]